MKIHLCCGQNIIKGWINVDFFDFGQEIVANLNEKWDFAKENSVDHIYCKDGFEHLDSGEHFLYESARLLKLGGTLQIWVPHFKNPSAYRLTHKRLLSWSFFDVFPEPHDGVQHLLVVSNKIYIGHKENSIWKPIHYIINKIPLMWERLFYVSNIEVVLKKI